MQLLKIQDPRDNLEKARLLELVRFAESHNVAEVKPTMPAQLIRLVLRNKGLFDIHIPSRPLGQAADVRESSATPENLVEVLAEDNLWKQWNRSQAAEKDAKPEKKWMKEVELPLGAQNLEILDGEEALEKFQGDIDLMKMTELRKACKAKGIKMKRTDKMVDLKAKLNEDTSECSQ